LVFIAFILVRFFKVHTLNLLGGKSFSLLIQGLKKNWEEIHEQYQGISVVTDTAPKKNRKERMEAEMKQLERDIETVERHSVIYFLNILVFLRNPVKI
jgi:hypothetical protein